MLSMRSYWWTSAPVSRMRHWERISACVRVHCICGKHYANLFDLLWPHDTANFIRIFNAIWSGCSATQFSFEWWWRKLIGNDFFGFSINLMLLKIIFQMNFWKTKHFLDNCSRPLVVGEWENPSLYQKKTKNIKNIC